MLEKFGLRTDLVANGKEAIDALEQLPYDLIFMDCQMPVMDGYQASRSIRDLSSKVIDHAIPIIAMTAHAMQGDRDRCFAAGMNDYISKPIDLKKLRRVLSQWLSQGAAPASSQKATTAASRPRSTPSHRDVDRGDKTLSPTVAVFDYSALSERLSGDEALTREIIETFLDDMPQQIDALRDAIDSGDILQATKQAHKIKGVAANVEGIAVSALSAEMEQSGKNGELEPLRQNMAELEQRYTQLKQAMSARL
jgi:CheY-like chemotaxis protein/HPt (histidine-containing phosphotransfer) domain-containing protein